MIYTVTLNPSLDYLVTVKDFTLGMTNRTASEKLLPGGKGLNVSAVLNNLGIENTALGFTAGFVGDEISRRVSACGIRSEFVKAAQGCSRINVKLINIDGTEINGAGPSVCAEELSCLLERLDRLAAGDVLVLAGSIPAALPKTIYGDIMARLSGKGVSVSVDASGELLLNVLQYHPFLIKPNRHELGEVFGVTVTTREEALAYAGELRRRGACNVLVSLGAEGAVLAAQDGSTCSSPAPHGQVVNSVGAGDSMVAGFLAGWMERRDYRHAFYMGVSAGSASAFSGELAAKREVMEIYHQLIR